MLAYGASRMTSRFPSSRLLPAARLAVPWLVGVAALLIRSRTLEIVSPRPCSGPLEIVSIAALAAAPGLTAGQWLSSLQALALVSGLAAFVALAARTTRNLFVAAAVGLAAGLSPLFPLTLAPPWEAARFAFCAAVALVWPRFRARTGRPFVAAAVAAGVCLSAVAVPGFLWPDVFGSHGSAPAISCVLSPPPADTVSLPAIAWIFGPFALGLVALGLAAETGRTGWPRVVAGAAIVSVVSALAARGVGSGLGPAAVWVALWWLTAAGLDRLALAIGTTPVARAAGVLMVSLLPLLQYTRAADERDDRIRPNGHEHIAVAGMTAILDAVPAGTALVEEDSTVDLALRASLLRSPRLRSRVAVIPREPAAVRRAILAGPVHAFPSGQADLSLRGFVVAPRVAGLAAITGVRRCQTIGDMWVDLARLGEGGRIALAADSESARGPVVAYFGGSARPDPRPDGWIGRTTLGFRFETFEQQAGTRAGRLSVRDSGVFPGEDHGALTAPFVLWLGLHRTPRAPLTLAVVLGGAFPAGIARLENGGAEAGRFTICEAPAVTIAPFE